MFVSNGLGQASHTPHWDRHLTRHILATTGRRSETYSTTLCYNFLDVSLTQTNAENVVMITIRLKIMHNELRRIREEMVTFDIKLLSCILTVIQPTLQRQPCRQKLNGCLQKIGYGRIAEVICVNIYQWNKLNVNYNDLGRGYSAHLKFEATKVGLEHVLKTLHPVQNVIYCRFYPSLQKVRNFYCTVRPKTQHKSLTFQGLSSGNLRWHLKSSKQGLGAVAHIHRDTMTAKQYVGCANWLRST